MTVFQRIRSVRTCPSCARAYAPGTRFCPPCDDPAATAYEPIIWDLGEPNGYTNGNGNGHTNGNGHSNGHGYANGHINGQPETTWLNVEGSALEDIRSILAEAHALIHEPATPRAASA